MVAMENVVCLAEFRRRKQLYATGKIHCAKCDALIRNIHVDSAPQTANE